MEKPLNLKARNKAVTNFLLACLVSVILIFFHVIVGQLAYNAAEQAVTEVVSHANGSGTP